MTITVKCLMCKMEFPANVASFVCFACWAEGDPFELCSQECADDHAAYHTNRTLRDMPCSPMVM